MRLVDDRNIELPHDDIFYQLGRQQVLANMVELAKEPDDNKVRYVYNQMVVQAATHDNKAFGAGMASMLHELAQKADEIGNSANSKVHPGSGSEKGLCACPDPREHQGGDDSSLQRHGDVIKSD